MITYEVEGVDRIAEQVRAKVFGLEAGSRLLIADFGAEVHDRTFQYSPYDALELYDDFHMRENIRIETDDDGLGVNIGWRAADFRAEGFEPYYLTWEFGSDAINREPRPSLTPAFEELAPSLEERFRVLLRGLAS